MSAAQHTEAQGKTELSIIVCGFDMQRELPRTIYTLSKKYQRDIESLNYEILVVDNGSPEPMNLDALCSEYDNVKGIRFENDGSKSPVNAINKAVELSEGGWLGIFIDGARLASPGLIAKAREAYSEDPTKVIGTLGFHLGNRVQMEAVQEGYNQDIEEYLLASVNWMEDGYRLFDISVFSGSCKGGWYKPMAESNAVFMRYDKWKELCGFDARFECPGGGYMNLEFWRRALKHSENHPWIILGEGTFHQVHGGAATNSPQEDRDLMKAEYERLTGDFFDLPVYEPRYVGNTRRWDK